MEVLHSKIKRLRLEKRIGQTEIAEIIGISRSAYIQIENGITKNISVDLGQSIARSLDISFVDLFDIETNLPELKKLSQENESLRDRIEMLEKDILKLNKIVALQNDKEERTNQDSEELKLMRSFLSLLESFQSVDNEFFAEHNKDIVKEDSLIRTFKFEVVESFFRAHGKKASHEIIKFQDQEKYKKSSEFSFLVNSWRDTGFWDKDTILQNITEEKTKFLSKVK
jgi:transcriptional regulator with XRE-family HTH domain